MHFFLPDIVFFCSVPLQRPAIPPDQLYIPVEIKHDTDTQPLEDMQAALKGFGFGQTTNDIASFISTTTIFASTLQSAIYPVVSPIEYFGIYQTWR